MVVSSSQRVLTNTWVRAVWDEFVAVAYDPSYAKYKAYFDSGFMRIEMPTAEQLTCEHRLMWFAELSY